ALPSNSIESDQMKIIILFDSMNRKQKKLREEMSYIPSGYGKDSIDRQSQDEALSMATEEDAGEETVAAIGATTRWVRLKAAGRYEVTIGDDDTTTAEAVAALKMSWSEIWRHYISLSTPRLLQMHGWRG
ncbi:hypothetical protein BHM03_00060856, partial [Ensete ventricosum]